MENLDASGQSNAFLKESLNQNVIKVTRKIIGEMTELQRFQKAKAHILDALNYKHPRFESQSLTTPFLFRALYHFETNPLWEWLLFLCGYVFLYLVVIDSNYYGTKIGMESTILFLFWVDTLILMYCKTYDNFRRMNKYSSFFYFKCSIIVLMTIDLIIFICLPCYDSRPIRPFRVLRCFVPLLFDPEMRKSIISLASAYKDVLVYFIFFTTIIVGYAFIGNHTLTFDPNFKDPSFPQNVDPYKSNYSDLGHMIFMVYVSGTFDSYPDNQILIIQNFEPNYIYYIVFVFANMFLFSSIPGSLIYLKFRETRSRILLIDEIRQQHSLILAFVTLVESQTTLSIQKLIKFLLYMYKYKIRYVEYITDICLKLDDNNNHSIQVNQFMQLSKILLQNSVMLPPSFEDIQIWVDFRKFMNQKFYLKQVVRHWIFQFVVSIIIILSFINAIQFLQEETTLVIILDKIFVWLFLIELMLRIIAIGPENFYVDRWNKIDSILVLIGLIYFFLPISTVEVIVKMGRIFRLAGLLGIISHSNYLKDFKFQIWFKLKNLYSILLEILPIILRFMPLFMFFFYIYGVVGMELFYNFYDTMGSPNYNQYQQFSNFASFIHSQYIMVQVLNEAGWSQVAYDHCWRAPHYFAYIMLFFCLIHITVVYILATLIKGIFWEVFFTVNTMFAERNVLNNEQIEKQTQLHEKSREIQEISNLIKNSQYIEPNTLIRRELIEKKFDKEIFQKLKKIYEHERMINRKMRRSSIANQIIDDWQINLNDLKIREELRHKYQKRSQISKKSEGSESNKLPIHLIEEIDHEDLESEISQLLDKLLVNPKIKYNEFIMSPKLFIDFLKTKLKRSEELIVENQFDLHSNPLYNQESMYCHIYEIHALLNIETSKRQQKALIINSLIDENVIDEEQGERLIRKKLQEKTFNVDRNGALRRLLLSGTDEDLIKKFQIEYFSDLYGYSYKHINKMTLEPLLKLEATLTYSLRNIMRYPQIDNTQFFQMITHIQDQISNKLLQRGSLFKFVYKLDCQGDVWFSIQYKRQQEMKIHFIKTGIWCYHKEMEEKEVLYARDIFNWTFPEKADQKNCEQYIKRFYQSFEGLAFSLLHEEEFFESDPCDYVYDLYIQYFDVERTMRFKNKKLEISKIMVVILSKEEQRDEIGANRLHYKLSDINRNQEKNKDMDFKLDESDQETFEKLKHIASIDSQKIVESEGLPFAYIVNLLKQLTEILTVSAQNFVYQIEKVLNEEYLEMADANKESELRNKENLASPLFNGFAAESIRPLNI